MSQKLGKLLLVYFEWNILAILMRISLDKCLKFLEINSWVFMKIINTDKIREIMFSKDEYEDIFDFSFLEETE